MESASMRIFLLKVDNPFLNQMESMRPASDPAREAGTGLRAAQYRTGNGNVG
jgi:hypothetical protein